jgi:uncharacterized protein YifE (UPF0438 family)
MELKCSIFLLLVTLAASSQCSASNLAEDAPKEQQLALVQRHAAQIGKQQTLVTQTCAPLKQPPYYNEVPFMDTDGGAFPEMSATNVCTFLGLVKASSQADSQPKDSVRKDLTEQFYPPRFCDGSYYWASAKELVTQHGVSFCKIIFSGMDNSPLWGTMQCECPQQSCTPLNGEPTHNGISFVDTDGGGMPSMSATNICKFLGLVKASSQADSQRKDSVRKDIIREFYPEGYCKEAHSWASSKELVTRHGVAFCKITFAALDNNPAWGNMQCECPQILPQDVSGFNGLPSHNGVPFVDTDGGSLPSMTATNICTFMGFAKASQQTDSQPKDHFRRFLTHQYYPKGFCKDSHSWASAQELVTQHGISFCKLTFKEVDNNPLWKHIVCESQAPTATQSPTPATVYGAWTITRRHSKWTKLKKTDTVCGKSTDVFSIAKNVPSKWCAKHHDGADGQLIVDQDKREKSRAWFCSNQGPTEIFLSTFLAEEPGGACENDHSAFDDGN